MSKDQVIESIEQWIEMLLLHSAFSLKRREGRASDSTKRLKFKWFNPAYIMEGTNWLTDNEYGYWSDATPSALSRPLNIAIVDRTLNESKPGHVCYPLSEEFQVQHLRAARPEEWRGLPWKSERYVLTTYFFKVKEGLWDSFTVPIADRGKAYYSPSRQDQTNIFKQGAKEFDRNREDDFTPQVRQGLGIQFTSEYFWHADIGWPEHPKIRLPMTAERAAKLFAMRDTPTDSQRRKALLHWIMGHQRVLNRGEESEKIVRVVPHVKGVYDFGWKGLNVQIYPSEALLRDAAKAEKVASSVVVQKERVEQAV